MNQSTDGVINPTMCCRRCGFDLQGYKPTFPEPRCPECGRSFDPDDPVTYHSPTDVEIREALWIITLSLFGLIATIGVWFVIILGGILPAYLDQYNNIILTSVSIIVLFLQSFIAVRAFIATKRTSDSRVKRLNYCSVIFAFLYFSFFSTLLM